MTRPEDSLDLDVDLEGGVIPISRAASSLAALLKRSRERRQPIVVTQKGYPAAVVLDNELFVALRERARRALEASKERAQQASLASTSDSEQPATEEDMAAPPIAPPEQEAPASPAPERRARGGRRPQAHQAAEAEPAPAPISAASPLPEPSTQAKGTGKRRAKAQP